MQGVSLVQYVIIYHGILIEVSRVISKSKVNIKLLLINVNIYNKFTLYKFYI